MFVSIWLRFSFCRNNTKKKKKNCITDEIEHFYCFISSDQNLVIFEQCHEQSTRTGDKRWKCKLSHFCKSIIPTHHNTKKNRIIHHIWVLLLFYRICSKNVKHHLSNLLKISTNAGEALLKHAISSSSFGIPFGDRFK